MFFIESMSDDVLIVLLLNIIVHIVFVCGSSEHQKSACPHYDEKKTSQSCSSEACNNCIRPHVIYVVCVRKMLKFYINVSNDSQETIVEKHD